MKYNRSSKSSTYIQFFMACIQFFMVCVFPCLHLMRNQIKIGILIFGILFANFAVAQGDYRLFKRIELGLPVTKSIDRTIFNSTFGDYNKDGFIDLFLSGNDTTILFYNKNGEFVKDTVSSFIKMSRSYAQFLDYDNDKDLDLFVTGFSIGGPVAKLYRNDSPHYSFKELKGSNFSFLGLQTASTSILDYNNDGFMDIFVTGTTDIGNLYLDFNFKKAHSILYKNNGGTGFTIADSTTFAKTLRANITGVDYNNDGRTDMIIQGIDTSWRKPEHITHLRGKTYFYKNNGNGFLKDTVNSKRIVKLTSAYASFGDYDNDGDLDMFTAGCLDETHNVCNKAVSKLYKNDSSIFSEVAHGKVVFDTVYETQSFFRDYNNDGFLDIFSFGTVVPTPGFKYTSQMRLYKNNSGTGFSEVPSAYLGPDSKKDEERRSIGLFSAKVSFVDYDNNGTVDIIATGGSLTPNVYIYTQDTISRGSRVNATRGTVFSKNTVPTPPTNTRVSFTQQNSKASFSWDAARDIETSQNVLSYNMYVGTKTNRDSIKVSSSFTENANGTRKISGIGLIQGTAYTIDIPKLANGRYYWGVQAIDGALAGGKYSQGGSFIVSNNGNRVKGLNPQTITFSIPPQKTITERPFTITAIANTTMPVRFTSSNPLIASISGNTVTLNSSGEVYISALVNAPNGSNDTTYIETTEKVAKMNVIKATQTISFADISPKYTPIGNKFVLSASASSGLEISYVASNSFSVSINKNTVTIKGIGELDITATQSGNNNYYEAASVTRSLVISKSNQTIAFASIPTLTIGSTYILQATASSGFRVRFAASNTTLVSINGNTLTAKASGSVDIIASQMGDFIEYNPATPVSVNLTIIDQSKKMQTITFASIPTLTIGNTYVLQATASSGLGVSFAASNTTLVSINGNTLTAVATGTVIITANQEGNAQYNPANAQQTVTVINQTVTINQTGTTTTPTLPALTFVEIPNNSIRIFPNPANDYITIQYDKTQKVSSAKVYDMSGKNYELKINNYELGMKADIKNLPKGEYILVIYGEKGEVLKTELLVISF